MKTFEMDNTCPFCGYMADRASEAMSRDGRGPKPNDASICISCSGVSIFSDKMTLRRPTEEENGLLEKDQALMRIQIAMQMAKENR